MCSRPSPGSYPGDPLLRLITVAPIFSPLPDKPDHDALEREILDLWESEDTFGQLREQNRGGPRFSFVDGPVTANRIVLGVHTAWGRTLKDVFQRYKALNGFHQRYQNGFDCQGLWIEVGVERELGLNSKREIEEYGLAEFARRCREVVARSSRALTEGSIRLGQWMDWGNDYFTFSDTNIEYIWRFLGVVHDRGWLYLGHRSTEWCPRCGTSLSQHELTQSGVYQERSDPSLFVRFPLLERPGESIVIWTTTPWTLPANVAAAVNPDAEYGLRETGEWVAVARYPNDSFTERMNGSELVGWTYRGPFDDLPPAEGVEHRVIPWDDVSLEEGSGSSTSLPARARRTSSSAGSTTSRCCRLSTRRAASMTATGGCTASRRPRPPIRSSAGSRRRASSSRQAPTSTGIRIAGAATRRSSGASPTIG